MDSYRTEPCLCAASIRSRSVGETFWRDRFIWEVNEKLNEKPCEEITIEE